MMLKPIDYTGTLQQSAKAAIECHAPSASSFSASPTRSRPHIKCMHIAEPLLFIDYRSVSPVPPDVEATAVHRTVPLTFSVVEVPATYPESDQQDGDANAESLPTETCPLAPVFYTPDGQRDLDLKAPYQT